MDLTHFTTVDQTSDPGFFLRFLDAANAIPCVKQWKPMILDELRLQPGMNVLDIGCGQGSDAFDLAARVGATGHVTGVDFSESLLAEANRRAVGKNLSISFEVGDAQALRFADGSFDAVRTERMLMHVPDAQKALSEMARVLRRGGRMAVLDMDWESQFCDSPYKETTRKIALSLCDSFRNGWIGRRLPRIFREVGMTEIGVDYRVVTVNYEFLQLFLGGHIARIVADGIISENDADLWWTHVARTSREGTFVYGFMATIVSGTKL